MTNFIHVWHLLIGSNILLNSGETSGLVSICGQLGALKSSLDTLLEPLLRSKPPPPAISSENIEEAKRLHERLMNTHARLLDFTQGIREAHAGASVIRMGQAKDDEKDGTEGAIWISELVDIYKRVYSEPVKPLTPNRFLTLLNRGIINRELDDREVRYAEKVMQQFGTDKKESITNFSNWLTKHGSKLSPSVKRVVSLSAVSPPSRKMKSATLGTGRAALH